MKVLFLSPSLYTIPLSLEKGFNMLNYDFLHYDYRIGIKSWKNKFNVQSKRLPYSLREKWSRIYFNRINENHKRIFDQNKPDIVLIYNNEMIVPDTISYFKKKGAKVIFYLGDNPYYTHTNDFFLSILLQSDQIVVPDSFWKEQLELLGITDIYLDFFYSFIESNNDRHEKIISQQKQTTDLLFVGTNYSTSWGYKRVLYLSKFAKMNIEIHGTSKWLRWLTMFPELKEKFILKKGRYSQEYMNRLHRNAKIYPVDANPGLLNGIHLRTFDCLAYDLLPLPEYRKDIETIFKGTGLPIVKDYNKASDLAQYFLDNDNERKELVKNIKDYVVDRFNPNQFVSRIVERI